MSLLGDYLNHNDAVRFRIEQLESLNSVISERKEQAYEAGEELRGLEARIKEAKTMFPGITEVEAWKKYTESLKQQNQILESDIVSKRKELADLLAKLGIAVELEKINAEKEKLKQEIALLEEYKSSLIKVEDVIFAVYTLPNGELIANAFVYIQDTIYDHKGTEYKGKHYKSIIGNRVIGLTYKRDKSLIDSNEGIKKEKITINTALDLWFDFEDVCIMLDSLEFLNKKAVNAQEIMEVLQLFKDRYTFRKEDGDVKVIPKIEIKRS